MTLTTLLRGTVQLQGRKLIGLPHRHLTIIHASDSMFLLIDFVRVTNCFYDFDYDYVVSVLAIIDIPHSKLCHLYSLGAGLHAQRF